MLTLPELDHKKYCVSTPGLILCASLGCWEIIKTLDDRMTRNTRQEETIIRLSSPLGLGIRSDRCYTVLLPGWQYSPLITISR